VCTDGSHGTQRGWAKLYERAACRDRLRSGYKRAKKSEGDEENSLEKIETRTTKPMKVKETRKPRRVGASRAESGEELRMSLGTGETATAWAVLQVQGSILCPHGCLEGLWRKEGCGEQKCDPRSLAW
jgi:hypothetical protein